MGHTLYTEPGRSTEAETLVSEALDFARSVWGERDPKYLKVFKILASVKIGERDYAKAAEINRQVLLIQDQTIPGDVAALSPQANLCICLINLERLDELEVALNRLDADVQRLVGENSIMFAVANCARGLLNFARGDNRTAILHLQKALGPFEAAYTPETISVVQTQAVIGLCMTRDDRAAEGEPWLRTAYEHGGKMDRAEFAHTIGNVETALGECLLAQKRYEETEPLLLTGYADLENAWAHKTD